MSYFEMIVPSLLQNIPEMLGWLLGLVLAVIMIGRGGGKAEKLFLAGCILLFVIQLASPFLGGLVNTLLHQGWRTSQAATLILSLPIGILGLAGFICLILAFWLRFTDRRELV